MFIVNKLALLWEKNQPNKKLNQLEITFMDIKTDI
jgi:hypothetical protein